VSFLQKAKEKASEVAREAADASTRAAGSVAEKVQDPDTQQRVKGGLSTAGKSAADASVKAAGAVAAKAQDPETQAKVKGGLASAGRSARTVVERIDPGILADVIIKATALQEKANARLRRKGSIYRIGEIQVTASLPPGISFSIERIAEAEEDGAAVAQLHSSTEILAAEAALLPAEHADAAPAIVSLDGEEQAAIAFEIADAEASMDAAVDVLGGSGSPAAADAGGVDGPSA
jgi:hypothetical protein